MGAAHWNLFQAERGVGGGGGVNVDWRGREHFGWGRRWKIAECSATVAMTTIPSGGFPVLCSSEAKYLRASREERGEGLKGEK